jgi:hypothetical protein
MYKAKVADASRELTAKEKIMLKDTSNAFSLDELTQKAQFNNEKVILNIDYYVTIDVHNDKADDKDYKQFILVDKDGKKYYTGSTSFINNFIDIFEELTEAREEVTIEIYRKESKNYKGKEFITCSVV